MNDLRDEAVVLRGYRSGEADRVVVLWTREHGKVRAIAKGVRKPTTKIGGGLEPLAHVSIFLATGKGLAIVRQVEHLGRYPTLHGSFERLTAGLALIEAVDAIPVDDAGDVAIFDLLVRALATLDDARFLPALVPAGFYLRLLALDGSDPILDVCAHCGSIGPLVAFDAAVGGVLCASCRSGRPLSEPGLALLRRLAQGQLAEVLAEGSPPGAAEVTMLTHEAIERHFGRRLKVLRSVAAVP